MAKINKIQVKSVDYEIEDLQAIHGTLKTINNETLLGDGNVETVGKKTEEGGEIFNNSTIAGNNSHAEGTDTSASGSNAHSEGAATIASGNGSHAEGYMSEAAGNNSHAEGYGTSALNEQSHAEGLQTTASGLDAHAEGYQTTASGDFSHSEGQNSKASGQSSHVEGNSTKAEASYSHAEGNKTTARGTQSHAEGASSNIAPEGTDAETLKSSWDSTKFNIALGTASHTEGLNNISGGNASHAEGEINYVTGIASHVEGYNNIVTGSYGAHAEGQGNTVSGQASHAEGNGNVASGAYSHAEGRGTQALNTVEHAEGKWNKSNTNTISSIGIGTNNENRKNAFEVSNTGEVYILNIGNYDGTNSDSASSINKIITNLPDFDTFVTESELTAKNYATKSALTSGLAGKANIEHTHEIADITNLQTTLNAKVPTTRTINGKALSANVVIDGGDIIVGGEGDYAKDTVQEAIDALKTAVDAKPSTDTNTTYTFASGTDGSFTVTPSTGSAQKVTIGKPATAGTADKVGRGITVSLNGTAQTKFDGSADVAFNVTAASVGAAASSHTHTLSQISNLNASWDSLLANAPSAYLTRWPSISEVTGKQNLVIKLNGGTTEGTNQFTYNGTATKTLSITPSSIGASASGHTHNYLPLTGGTLTGPITIEHDMSENTMTIDGSGYIKTTTNFTVQIEDTLALQYAVGFLRINGNIALTENNFSDYVTPSSIGAAASSHNHSAANIISGTLDIARLPSITDAKITSISASKITGTIPQANLPSYVDDVLEYSSKSSFPQTGESGKIYVDTTTNLTYRWSGSAYVEISPSLALGETSSTAYRGDRGKIAYDHSQETGNPHNLTLSNLGITATAAELNYMDGVTSNVQTQLNGKSASSHTHSANDITSGKLNIARIPTGLSGTTVALGNHTHSGYATVSHTHGTNTVIELTGYTGESIATRLDPFMSLNTALASLQNQIQAKAGSLSDLGVTATVAELNKLDGLTATVTELNYVDGVTSNIQTQLNRKASSSHTHSASDITSGTLNIARIPIGTGSDAVALGSHTHSLATTSAGGFMSAADKSKLDGITDNADSVSVSRNLTSGTQIASITINGTATALYAPTNTDTKNTTGTSNSASKLYLAGGTSQSSTGVQTYSNSAVYTQSGQLYATQMNASNGFYETSDARLKNFKDDIKALDTVDQIPTKYFTWKKDENQESQIGTSAQEIEKLYPELVSKIEDDTLTVDYAKLSIIALAAIKELKAEVESLKEEIWRLKSNSIKFK